MSVDNDKDDISLRFLELKSDQKDSGLLKEDRLLYEQERKLRDEVLLFPIGQKAGAWEMHDSTSLHLVAVKQNSVVGCVLFHPDENAQEKGGKLFQMAVAKSTQGKGLGSRLVQALLERLKADGYIHVRIHSRSHVNSFYERFGFKVDGPAFEEVGIKHNLMRKRL